MLDIVIDVAYFKLFKQNFESIATPDLLAWINCDLRIPSKKINLLDIVSFFLKSDLGRTLSSSPLQLSLK